MEQYAIVEFDDGLQMIPTIWLIKDKKQAYWPTVTSNERFSKTVRKCLPKMDSWPLYEIKKILATANTYEKGMIKLKKAKFLSDLNSDSDDEVSKKNRKFRAKNILTSESSNEEESIVYVPPYPKLPKVQKKNDSEYPVNKALKSKCVSKHIENVDLPTTTSIDSNRDKCVLKQLENDNFDPSTPSKDSINTNAITQFERYIIRKLLDIEHKISSIQDRQRNMNSKIDYIQNQIQTFGLDDNKKIQNDAESDYMELFPIENIEKLQELEQLLMNNKINRTTLMKQLARIGGTDIKSITFNILRRIMSDSVGSMFSYVGGKKKQSFFDLHIRKILFGAVRIYYPEATEQNISDPIKSWLRHASERNHKKNAKKSLIQDDQYAEMENMDSKAKSDEKDNRETDDEDESD